MKIFYLISFLATVSLVSNAQTSQTKNASAATNCGCPGEVWNTSNVSKPNVAFSAPGVSKRVMFTDFGFSIPHNASITGVEVNFSYSTTASGIDLDDQAVMLLYWGNLSGSDKSSLTGNYTGTGSVTLGGASDTWGIGLFPSDVNSSSFGFNFKLNSAQTGILFSFLNGVSMTVYYTTPTGIKKSQTSMAGNRVFLNEGKLHFSHQPEEGTELTIHNLLGEKVISTSNIKDGVDIGQLPGGVYVYTLQKGNQKQSSKFIIE